MNTTPTCNNCGAVGGDGYGFCRHCTPKEYMDYYFTIGVIRNKCYF